MKHLLKTRKKPYDRMFFVFGGILLFTLTMFWRLFDLQILKHDEYFALAENQHENTQIDPAKRGKIYVKADQSGTYTEIAKNITLDLIYVDPNPYVNKDYDSVIDVDFVSQSIAPILYEHYCTSNFLHPSSQKSCAEKLTEFTKLPPKKSITIKGKSGDQIIEQDKSEEDLKSDILQVLKERLHEREVTFVPLLYTKDTALLSVLKANVHLAGIYVGDGIVYGNPVEVQHNSDQSLPNEYVEQLKQLNIKKDVLTSLLARKISRYVVLARGVDPELTKKIMDWRDQETTCPQLYAKPEKYKDKLLPANNPICERLKRNDKGKLIRNFFGLKSKAENWRFYPEDGLAAQVVGFMNFEKEGNYGVEELMDNQLRGNDGEITMESDPMGRLIANNLKADQIKPREDGVDIYLTIDRVVQKKVEELLAAKVKNTRANSGVAIVMDPFSGKILSLAQYPTFNQNAYSDAYEMERISADPGKGIPMFIKDEKGELTQVPEKERGKIPSGVEKWGYINKVGPGAFYNSITQGTYEPGSIFKPLIMAAGIDSGELTPQTTYVDRGEVKVDEFTIKNVSEKCIGTHNMINVLNYSCNVGMSFIAKKLGKALMYEYITRFGLGSRTDIELPDEAKGRVYPYEEWSDARLFNAAFGQGLTVTPLQMAQAYSVIANGGVMVIPQIIEKLQYPNGKVDVRQRQVVKRVISKETADTIAAMLTSVVEVGGSKPVQMKGFYVAGKTGTAQIASSSGGYEEDGIGATNGSFAGFFPSNAPQYVIITKIERPRSSKWADQTAAPLFKEIAEFLVDYYHIQPQR